MKTDKKILLLAAFFLLAFALGACGGGGQSGEQGSSTTTEASGNSQGRPNSQGEDQGKAKFPQDQAAQGRAAAKARGQKPASLATDPSSILGARLTAAGAVQTLPPSRAAREEAMRNTYASIENFGSEAEGPEATDITFALVQYLTAKAEGDSATACARLYSLLRENVAKLADQSQDPAVQGGGCPTAFGTLMKRVPRAASAEAARIDVASVRRGDGNRAFVIYKTPNTLSADMPMYLDRGVWTVGALEAYVLTPEHLAQNGG